jgi:glutathione peroxidase-family protein
MHVEFTGETIKWNFTKFVIDKERGLKMHFLCPKMLVWDCY